MALRLTGYSHRLRSQLCARNAAFAREGKLNHVESYGEMPVIVYAPEVDGNRHGNFMASSYKEILKRVEWSKRLAKVHTSARRALPAADRRWRELDSSTSSDALLMNIFCCPGVCGRASVASILGTEVTDVPQFGYKARVPLRSGRSDQTEIDMKLGDLLVEAKLTEGDFQKKNRAVVESYRDLETVFSVRDLPRSGEQYVSYQLIRNVLAAHASGLSFCVIADARRPDLIEAWHAIMRCVCHAELRTRCKVLTWQELSRALPGGLRKFLDVKYGIE
ncbi:MAG TPA: hypothetical protein VI685_02685 [Candidatus Angelobacter sp.]